MSGKGRGDSDKQELLSIQLKPDNLPDRVEHAQHANCGWCEMQKLPNLSDVIETSLAWLMKFIKSKDRERERERDDNDRRKEVGLGKAKQAD
jgi:hypothetical protein